MNKFLILISSLFIGTHAALADPTPTVQEIYCYALGNSGTQFLQVFLEGNPNPTTWTDNSGNKVPGQRYSNMFFVLKGASSGEPSLQGYFLPEDSGVGNGDASFQENNATTYAIQTESTGITSNGPSQLTVQLTMPSDQSATFNIVSTAFDESTGGYVTTETSKITGLSCQSYPSNEGELWEAKFLLN